jgi:hypothetical protein
MRSQTLNAFHATARIPFLAGFRENLPHADNADTTPFGLVGLGALAEIAVDPALNSSLNRRTGE